MWRWFPVAVALLLAAVLSGCGEPTYRDRPLSYWIENSRSPNPQTRQQAIGALMAFPKDERASARLNEIRTQTLAQREQKWQELREWLADTEKTRQNRSTIATYIGTMPESEEGIAQYTATAFPGKWTETREILNKRVEQTSGEDREMYQSLLRLR